MSARPDRFPITGTSIAGIETAIELPSFKLVLDMGRCSRTAVNYPTVLVSHGHLDHVGAIVQHAARRALLKMSPGVYLVPRVLVPAIERFFEGAGELDGQPIPRQVIGLAPGDEYRLTARRVIRPFPTDHRVPSQGYTVWERRHHLRPEFRGLPGAEIARLRAQGVAVDAEHEVALVAFTGDTRIDVLDRESHLHTVQTLILETSFLDARVSVADARTMGHIHLDELLARRALLHNERLVFSHFSARYTPREVREILASLPDDLRDRVEPLL